MLTRRMVEVPGRDTVESSRDRLGWAQTRPMEPRALPHRDPERIGRYAIDRRLGVGGMGVVYRAFDGQMQRPVALKVLRVGDADVDRERLRREAQGLARLSHPNVVEVFEIGEHVEPGSPPSPYVVMQLVDGAPLDRWLRLRRRRPAEILPIFLQAGEGLAAAHAAGLVHRDFKPGNVLVGRDGRVRVVDFGLVQEIGAAGPSASESASRSGDALPPASPGESLTKTGTLVGTPAYMSPEQLTRLPLGPGSDQFAFCVALFEAVFGQHPFVFDGRWSALPYNVLEGTHVDPPAEPRVPARLTATILRGLEVRPEDRWPSMDALLAELHRAGERRSPRLTLVGLTVVLALGGSWALARPSAAESVEPCERAAASGEPLPDGCRVAPERAAPSAAARPSWADALVQVDALMRDGALEEANALAEQLLVRAELERLPVLAAEASLRAGQLQARTGDVERAVGRLEHAYLEAKRLGRDRLAAGSALALLELLGTRSDREVDAARWVRHARVEIERLDDPDLTSRFYNAHGRSLRTASKLEEALGLHERALALQRARPEPNDGEIASALFQIGSCLGLLGQAQLGRTRLEEALRMQRRVFGDRDPRIAMSLLNLGVSWMSVDEERALQAFEESLSIVQEAAPTNPNASWAALLNISGIYRRRGDTDAAVRALHQYLEVVESHTGVVDPSRVAWVRGEIAMLEKRYEDAIVQYERAALGDGVQRYEKTRGLLNVGYALRGLGRDEQALVALRRALAAIEPGPGATFDTIALHDWLVVVQALADTLFAVGESEQAQHALSRARTMLEGYEQPAGLTLMDLFEGKVLNRAGRRDEARLLLQRAVEGFEAYPEAERAYYVEGLVALAELERETGRRAVALERAEQAVRVAERLIAGQPRKLLPRAWFLLARCLPDAEAERARSLAERARAHWAEQAQAHREELAQVDRWLKDMR